MSIGEPLPEMQDHVEEETLITEVRELDLPNLVQTVEMQCALSGGMRTTNRPLHVRPPLPGRYTTRVGDRLSGRELIGAIDEWILSTNDYARCIIQGGNRYVSAYAKELYDQKIPDIKVMSVEKAPLSTQLLTVLSSDERQAGIHEEQLAAVIPILDADIAAIAHTKTRAELLKIVANCNLKGPFESIATDTCLEDELARTVQNIQDGIYIPNLTAIAALMQGTEVADLLGRDEPIHFLDDLFYRGRTLYSLGVLMSACGGDPANIRLSTICSDNKSKDLTSPFHSVLRRDVLYPYENSIRTEQGYWQDVGDHYLFTDMGAYWEYLHTEVDANTSRMQYQEWQLKLHSWAAQLLPEDMDMSIVEPLLSLSVYHHAFGIDLNADKIIDQKGYKIGACVPFAQLIDRFVSQEEPVEVRSAFKAEIRRILSAIESATTSDPTGYDSLVSFYSLHSQSLDYEGLRFMMDPDLQYGKAEVVTSVSEELVSDIAHSIATQANEIDAPFIVGINGVDGSGKTVLTDNLRNQLELLNLPVTVVHIDDFTLPYEQRSSDPNPVNRYYNNTFDIKTLQQAILGPLRKKQLGSVLLSHESPSDPTCLVEHKYSFTNQSSIVLVEGVFLFRPELRDYYDMKIFVDIPPEEMKHRTLERDVPRMGFEVLKKLITRYMPAQALYLAGAMPEAQADVVIDNTDWDNPYITTRSRYGEQATS